MLQRKADVDCKERQTLVFAKHGRTRSVFAKKDVCCKAKRRVAKNRQEVCLQKKMCVAKKGEKCVQKQTCVSKKRSGFVKKGCVLRRMTRSVFAKKRRCKDEKCVWKECVC